MNCGRDVGIDEAKSIAAANGCGLIRKSEVVKGAIEPIAGTVAGKHASRSITAVRCGGKTNNEKPGVKRP